MRNFLRLACAITCFLSIQSTFAQVGVGTTTPNQSAALDITATNKGVLMPRVALVAANNWSPLTNTPTEGMIVYNTATAGAGMNVVSPGFYYWYQSTWKPIGQGTSTGSATFNCNNIAVSSGLQGATITNGVSYSGTITVSYTNGDGGSYSPAGQIINGLTFLRTAGTLANGSGTIVYNVSGTYTGVTGSTETFVMNLPGATCSVVLPAPSSLLVTNLNCQAGIPAVGIYELNRPIPGGATKTVTVTPAAAGPYTITTNAVAGVSFSASGNFTAGQVGSQQTVLLTASGTPSSTGLKTFIVTAGSQVCTFNLNFTTAANFNCANIISTLTQGALVSGDTYSGTVTIPYTTGNGNVYPATTVTANGLTLTRTPGTFAPAGGNIVYTLSGTYAGTGGAVGFTLPESGCTVYMGAAVYNAGSLNCGGAQAGTYARGTAMTTGNTKTITAVANTIGYYSATTNTLNGVSFSASGFIGTPGSISIPMVATGTPIAAGAYTYTVTFGGQTCIFTITFTGSATFNCGTITNTFTGNLVNGNSYGATITQTYTAGNGAAYPASTLGPIDGLTLTAPAGTYLAGGGSIVYTLSGTFTGTTDNLVAFLLPESGCTINIGAAAIAAASLNCTGLLTGVYTVGTAVTAANTKTISVNVTSTGGYSIVTNTPNNVTFSGSGSFTTTGIQNIILTASGTATSGGSPSYNVAIGGQTCTFSVPFSNPVNAVCASASTTLTSPLVSGTGYSGTVSIPYVLGNGQPYSSFAVGPTSGLTFTRVAGTYTPTGGTIVYNISGTYNGATNGSLTFSPPEACPVIIGQPDIIPNSLSCGGALTGVFQAGISTVGNTKAISFATTSTGNYNISSNNLSSVSFSINTTLSAAGSQTVLLTASGVPSQSGTFTYTITLDGQSCSFPVTILPVAVIDCGAIVNGLPTPPLVSGTSYTGTVTVPYTAGNGQAYGVTSINSNGLTLNRVAGTYATGGGSVVYNIGGTYTGTSNFVSFTLPEANCVVSSGAGVIQAGSLNCSQTPNGAYTVGVPMTAGNSKLVGATTSNGGPITFSTNTVNGISFSTTGTFAGNAGFSVTMAATGTPISTGTFMYTVTAGTQTCSFPITFTSPVTFNCAGITTSLTGPLVNGTPYSGTVTVPYTGGNGAAYGASVVGPVNGLILTAPAGTYSGGNGSIVYTIIGTYTGITNGGANFTFPESGCSFMLGAASFTTQSLNCGGTLSGTYQNQVPVTGANTKVITVDVTAPGGYTISTNHNAGIIFSASGVFTTTGLQTVTLTATGIPNITGNLTYLVTAGGQTCSFNVPIVGAVVYNCTGLTNTLPGALVNGGNYVGTVTLPYTGVINTPYTSTSLSISGLTLTRVAGTFAASGNITYNMAGTYTGTSGASVNFTLPDGGCVVTAGGANYTAGSLSCIPAPAGNYVQGVAMTVVNTKAVTINVLNPGTWTGSTTTVNGVTFNGSGTFAGINGQTAVLTATGTPTATGTFNYPVTLNGQNCNFNITFGAAQFNCSGIVNTLPTLLINGNTYNTGTVFLPYTAGNGTPYTTTTVTSAGLTLTRTAGTYNAGGGNVIYTISGVYSGPAGGTVGFTLPEGCSVSAGAALFNTPNCSGALAGTYEAGVAMTAANTKMIDLNFIFPGFYNIGAASQNGVTFGASGYVTTPGVQTLTLVATGTPVSAGTFTYSVNANGQVCTFTVTFTPAASFDCGGITGVPVVQVATNVNYTGTITLPYTNGNGSAYGSLVVNSGNVLLTRTPGTFQAIGGTVVYTMSGASNNGSNLVWTLPESGCVIALGTIIYVPNTLSCGLLAGTYVAGTPMTPANTKTYSINVSTPGTYSIISTTANGVTFAGSGVTTTTGVQDILLTATGTPIAPGTYYYNISVGGQACNFGVTYQ